MKTIFEIFKNDIKNLLKSKVAIFIILGIIFIPGIYAWLNIDSNWDPYDNTGNIPIAVVNQDTGATILGEDLNIGEEITNKLEQNNAMAWTFTDEATATEGVDQGTYYGAIVIPENFSQNLTTIISDENLTKPTFDFYVNNKKNPIAPIIVNKAMGAIQDSANQAFTNTLIYKITDAAKQIGIIDKGEDTTSSLIAKLSEAKVKIGQFRNIIKTTSLAVNATSQSLSSLESIYPILENFNQTTQNNLDHLQNNLDLIHDATELFNSKELIVQLSEHITALQKIQNLLEKLYQKSTNTITNTENIVSNLDSSLNSLELSMQYAVDALQSIDQLGSSLDITLANFQTDLDNTISAINSIKESEVLQDVINLLHNDPSVVADFLSNPIASNEIDVYPITNYGSKMAPFYSILACWVGCTVLATIIKIDIKKSKITQKAKNYQKFLGRFMLFGSLAILQGLVIGVGDLILQVQTVNLPLFLFTLMLSSLTFSLIIYSLAAVFGKIGQAIAIIIMVLQVAGSGGTFPIELLPRFFQVLQPFMPFYPSVNAVRETIGGFYQNDYSTYLLMLLCHLAVALAFGLIFSKYTSSTKNKFQKKLHTTNLID